MPTDGQISRAQVSEHLMDDVAHCRDLITTLDATLQRMVDVYRIDQSDDAIQEDAISHLTDELQAARRRLEGLVKQAQAVEATGRIPELSYREVTTGGEVVT